MLTPRWMSLRWRWQMKIVVSQTYMAYESTTTCGTRVATRKSRWYSCTALEREFLRGARSRQHWRLHSASESLHSIGQDLV